MKVKVSVVHGPGGMLYPRDTYTVIRSEEHQALVETDTGSRQWVGNSFLLTEDGGKFEPLDLSPAEREPVTLPVRMRMDGAAVKAINFMLGSSDEEDDTPTDAILWVGNLEGDEGEPVHGPHLANAEYPEEGSITLVEFAAPSNPVISDEMVERGLACYSEGGCSGLDERERREVVTDIISAALSVKPQSGE